MILDLKENKGFNDYLSLGESMSFVCDSINEAFIEPANFLIEGLKLSKFYRHCSSEFLS